MATKKTYSANKNASKNSMLRGANSLDESFKKMQINFALVGRKLKTLNKQLKKIK